jgi:NAD+ synthase
MNTPRMMLCIVDPLHDFMNPEGALYVKGSDKIIAQIVKAIQVAQYHNMEIVVPNDKHHKLTAEFILNGGAFPEHCVDETEGCQIIPEILEQLNKGKYTILPKDEVDVWVNNADTIQGKIEETGGIVFVCGVATEYCVMAAWKGFVARGWRTILLRDAVMGIHDDICEQLIYTLYLEKIEVSNHFAKYIPLVRGNFISQAEKFGYYTEEHIPEIKAQIKKFIIKQLVKHNKDGIVLGMSGGVDSSLVACLVCDAINDNPKYGFYPLSIPSETSRQHDFTKLGLLQMLQNKYLLAFDTSTIPINNLVKDMKFVCGIDDDFNIGNMTSRIRANILHTVAASRNYLVIGTGNKDEDYGVGYYTLFGDGAVHCSPIGGLSKRVVKLLLADYLKDANNDIRSLVDREPSAELEPNQTDFIDLGYSYEFVELAMMIIGGNQFTAYWKARLSEQYMKDFEKLKKLGARIRFLNSNEAIQGVIERHRVADMKSALVRPPVCKISIKGAR